MKLLQTCGHEPASWISSGLWPGCWASEAVKEVEHTYVRTYVRMYHITYDRHDSPLQPSEKLYRQSQHD